MKKSSLKKIPLLKADEKDREFVSLYGHPYLAKPERVDVDGEHFLILNVYKQEDLLGNIAEPFCRVFQGKKEFLTEVVNKRTWSKRAIKDLLMVSWKNPQIVIRQKSGERMVKSFFREGRSEKRAIDLMHEKQMEIKERELGRNKKKKIEKIRKLFAGVKPFSEAFEYWLDDQALYGSQYIFYDYERKKNIRCMCSHCKTEFVLDRGIPRHNKEGICPICKRPAVFKAKGKLIKRTLTDKGEAVKLERMKDGILMRHVMVYRKYEKEKPETWKMSYYEDYRALLQEDGKARYFEKIYAEHGTWIWRETFWPSNFSYFYHLPYTMDRYERLKHMPGVLYTRNLKQCLKGTVFQYCGIESYERRYHPEMIAAKKYLETYLKIPQLEYFAKAGLCRICDDILWRGCDALPIDFQAKGLKDALQVSKEELRLLREYDLDCSYVETFQKMKECGISLTETEKRNFPVLYGSNPKLLEKAAYAPIRKITSYLAKQMERYHGVKGYRLDSDLPEVPKSEQYAYQNLARDWIDYLRWAQKLGHDINSRALLFPKDLGKAHDQMDAEYRAFQKKERQKELKRMRKVTDQILKAEARLLGGKIEDGEYIFMVPRKWQDLRQEGDTLGHCVGSYVEHIAKGRCSVYFVRKKEEPETPFYTVEYRDGKVVQCQGKGRCAPTEKVKDFLAYATERMQHIKGEEKLAA